MVSKRRYNHLKAIKEAFIVLFKKKDLRLAYILSSINTK